MTTHMPSSDHGYMTPTEDAARPYHHGDLERTALDAALALLREAGEIGLSMREVAKRVGVAHRALYRWYPDRYALLAAIAERGFSTLCNDIESAFADSNEPPRRAFVRTYVRFARREPELYRVTMSRNRAERKKNARLAAAIERLVALSVTTFSEEETDPRDLVVAIWAQLHGLIGLMDAHLLTAKTESAFQEWAVALTDRVGGPIDAPKR